MDPSEMYHFVDHILGSYLGPRILGPHLGPLKGPYKVGIFSDHIMH